MIRSTGAGVHRLWADVKETSQPVDLLISVARGGPRTLAAQIEDQLRRAIRDGSLRGRRRRLPSTRDLAVQLGVSRRVVVDAYAQLAAEGYLNLRQGARPLVSRERGPPGAAPGDPLSAPARLRFDFRPSRPSLSAFPRAAWLRSLRAALSQMADAELGYGDPRGADTLARRARRLPRARPRRRRRARARGRHVRLRAGAVPRLPCPCRGGRDADRDGGSEQHRRSRDRHGAPVSSRCRSASTSTVCGSTSSSAPRPTP